MAAGVSSATESTTSLFVIPRYSRLCLLPPGSPPTLLSTMRFRHHTWQVEVYFKGVTYSIYIVVSTKMKHSASGTGIRIEILDNNWEHTVFRMERTLGSDTWLRNFTVEKKQLEALCVDCVGNILDLKKQKRQQQAAARLKWWLQLRRRVSGYMQQSMEKSALPLSEKRRASGYQVLRKSDSILGSIPEE
jgi:hypothetical protein